MEQNISIKKRSKSSREHLRNLNLMNCPKINIDIYDGLNDRAGESPELFIYSFGTKLASAVMKHALGSTWLIICEGNFEKETFFW